MGISINGPSGIDTAYIIDSLTEIENQRVVKVEQSRDAYQVKIDAYNQLRGILADIGTKANALNDSTDFDLFTTKSSDTDLVSIITSAGAQEAQYSVKTFQLATNEKLISTNSLIADQHAALSTYGVSAGTIEINGTQITVDAADTLQDLRRKINESKDSDGAALGVNASVIKLADNNFRLVLTAADAGSQGVSYKDIAGSTLQNLGIILDAAGDKGNTTQTLTSGINVAAAFAGLAPGQTVQYSGKDHGGNTVSGSFFVGAASTVDDLLAQMEEDFNGLVDATIDGAGNLVLTDLVQGRSQLSVASLDLGGTDAAMAVTTAGVKGAGVLTVGTDAYFSVDGLAMSSSGNNAQGFIAGVTLELNQVSGAQAVQIEIKRDVEGIEKKVTDLFASYNALLMFQKTATSYGNVQEEGSKKGVLAGDSTVGAILQQVRAVFQTSFSQFSSSYGNMIMVGQKTNSQTGEFELDSALFRKAIDEDIDGVMKLFTTSGFASTNSVQMGRYSKDTKSGIYDVEEVDSDTLRMRVQGSADWYTSDPRAGDIVSFTDGPAKGLLLTAATGSLGGVAQTFTFSKGIATQLDELVKGLNSSTDGLVKMRQDSFQKSIDSANDRIISLEKRVESYRERLVKQFAKMEQSLNEMKSQSANMLAALGSN